MLQMYPHVSTQILVGHDFNLYTKEKAEVFPWQILVECTKGQNWFWWASFRFSYSGPKIGNDLPYDVRASESLNSVKEKLKNPPF